MGHNLLRPAALVFPLMLLVAVLAGFRPRWLAYPAVAVAFAANVGPYVATVITGSDPAAKAYVLAHSSRDFRLEVVPTINHWESFYVPRAGFAIARGWYQQLDCADNPRLNRRGLGSTAYRAWLRSLGLRYVILGNDALAARDRRGRGSPCSAFRGSMAGRLGRERTCYASITRPCGRSRAAPPVSAAARTR